MPVPVPTIDEPMMMGSPQTVSADAVSRRAPPPICPIPVAI